MINRSCPDHCNCMNRPGSRIGSLKQYTLLGLSTAYGTWTIVYGGTVMDELHAVAMDRHHFYKRLLVITTIRCTPIKTLLHEIRVDHGLYMDKLT